MSLWWKCVLNLLFGLPSGAALLCGSVTAAEIALKDDAGNPIRLARPAMRIVSLAPNLTEMLFNVGAGDRVVATVEFSDHPPAARVLPRVGNSATVDAERIAAFKPDLVVGWPHGAAQRQLPQLRRLGFAVFVSDPRTLDDIADSLEALGRLAGTELAAQAAANAFRKDLARLRATYAKSMPLRVFLQIWSNPLMTINDRHLFSDVLRLCGGQNTFGDNPQLASAITREAVFAAAPDVIIALANRGDAQVALNAWRKWPQLGAVTRDQLYAIDPDKLLPLTPRVLAGAQNVCDILAQARSRPRP